MGFSIYISREIKCAQQCCFSINYHINILGMVTLPVVPDPSLLLTDCSQYSRNDCFQNAPISLTFSMNFSNLQVRERCRKVTEEKQSMEEKLAHKDEECEALKSIVIAAQKDGNINGLISAADSNLLLSKVGGLGRKFSLKSGL